MRSGSKRTLIKWMCGVKLKDKLSSKEDDGDDVSTTWVTSNLPELTDPTALEMR